MSPRATLALALSTFTVEMGVCVPRAPKCAIEIRLFVRSSHHYIKGKKRLLIKYKRKEVLEENRVERPGFRVVLATCVDG